MRHMDIAEFRRLGFLREANRQFFHPHGLALEVTRVDGDWAEEHVTGKAPRRAALFDAVFHALRLAAQDAPPLQLPNGTMSGDALEALTTAALNALYPPGSEFISGVWDCRDDPEGVWMADEPEGKPEARRAAETVAEERARHAVPRAIFFKRLRWKERDPASLARAATVAVDADFDVEPVDFTAGDAPSTG